MEKEALPNTQKLERDTLFRVMEKVVESWVYLSVRSMGDPVDGIAPLPLERMVEWKGLEGAVVVIRTSEDFGDFLAGEILEGEAGISGEDAFNELVNIYCGHLLAELRKFHGRFSGPFLPRTSKPADWPGRAPDAACALLVEDTPLEIRLWLGVSRNE